MEGSGAEPKTEEVIIRFAHIAHAYVSSDNSKHNIFLLIQQAELLLSTRMLYGHNLEAVGGLVFLVLVDLAHAASFFNILKSIGAVSSALLKGAQTISVFLISAFLFCSSQASQCLTSVKVLSIFLVLCGTLCYGTARQQKRPT